MKTLRPLGVIVAAIACLRTDVAAQGMSTGSKAPVQARVEMEVRAAVAPAAGIQARTAQAESQGPRAAGAPVRVSEMSTVQSQIPNTFTQTQHWPALAAPKFGQIDVDIHDADPLASFLSTHPAIERAVIRFDFTGSGSSASARELLLTHAYVKRGATVRLSDGTQGIRYAIIPERLVSQTVHGTEHTSIDGWNSSGSE